MLLFIKQFFQRFNCVQAQISHLSFKFFVQPNFSSIFNVITLEKLEVIRKI